MAALDYSLAINRRMPCTISITMYSVNAYQETTCVGQGCPRFLVVFLYLSYKMNVGLFNSGGCFSGHILEFGQTRRKMPSVPSSGNRSNKAPNETVFFHK